MLTSNSDVVEYIIESINTTQPIANYKYVGKSKGDGEYVWEDGEICVMRMMVGKSVV